LLANESLRIPLSSPVLGSYEYSTTRIPCGSSGNSTRVHGSCVVCTTHSLESQWPLCTLPFHTALFETRTNKALSRLS
jgi:hypothetical protein